jgi:hypothetical protein
VVVLHDDGECAGAFVRVEGAQVGAVEEDPSVRGVPESREQTEEGGLARTRWSDQRGESVPGERDGDVLDHRGVVVAERDVLDPDESLARLGP